MPTILIAWELGGGLGHVVPLREVGEELARRGHRVRIAATNIPLCEQAFAGTEVEAMPCPVLPLTEERLRVPCTFSDILHDCGYASPERVIEAVGQWRKLLEDADALIANYSPTALLAARSLDVPTLVTGSATVCPTDVTPLPSLHHDVTEPHWAAEVEATVLGSMNAALTTHGGKPLERVAQLFAAANRRRLLTLPELDHYPDRPPEDRVRPFGLLPGEPVTWASGTASPRVFVYLRDEPTTEPVLRGLAIKGVVTIAYVRGPTEGFAAALQGSSVRLVTSPIDLRPMLRSCDAIVHNGGHITACLGLLSGVPQLILPLSLEQAVTGRRLRACGAGLDAPVDELNSIAAALEDLLDNESYANAARAIAYRHGTIEEDQSPRVVANALEALVSA